MDNEGRFIMSAVLAVIVLGISIPWSIAWYYTTTTKAAIEAGYEQQTLQGVSGVHWVKVDK